ncbi:MAG: tetratricopeptide repeat protein [Acidobacteriota bacterium]
MRKAVFLPLLLAILAIGPASDIGLGQDQPQSATTAPADENVKKGADLNAARQYSQAESVLRAAVAANPADPNAHLQLAVALFEQNKIEEAGRELELAAPLQQGAEKQQADFYRYRGAVYVKQGKWNEGVQDLEKAIKLDPTKPYNHYYIGVAYGKQGRPDKMVEHLGMFLKLAPNAPEAPRVKALLASVQ